jgi:N utilization substance protein A
MQNTNVARTEFAAAIVQIATDRKIPAEAILNAIKQALISAYKKQLGDEDQPAHITVNLNENTGEARILSAPATKVDEETGEVLEWDEKKTADVTPAGFGRIAAQTAKQVILQKIRESEKDQIIADYQDRVGEIVTGTVLRMDGRMVVVDIGRGQAYMPPEEQMRGEFYRMNMRLTVYIKEIRETHKGQTIIVSRAAKELVSKLFEREVPEVASGAVEVVAIAREAGVRTKMAVKATQDGVDPVGSCVGQRGVRVQEVIKELNNEKIDIIPYVDSKKVFIQAALAPAESLLIDIDEAKKMISVTAPDEQLSLAIGRGGQNVRLAAKLTGYKITIKSSGGEVKSKVTGEEEYEIDTIVGLNEETRQKLIVFKLTTVSDLQRFADKWRAFEEITPDQQQLLEKAVTQFETEEAERSAAYEAKGKMKVTSSDTETTQETGEAA